MKDRLTLFEMLTAMSPRVYLISPEDKYLYLVFQKLEKARLIMGHQGLNLGILCVVSSNVCPASSSGML